MPPEGVSEQHAPFTPHASQTTSAAQQDEWVVVGSKGKPRRSGKGVAVAASCTMHASAAEPSTSVPVPMQLPQWPSTSIALHPRVGRRSLRHSPSHAERLALCTARLERHRQDIQASPVWASVRQAMASAAHRMPGLSTRWAEVSHLVVYGLGSIEDSKTSQYQLAMATLLVQLLPGLQQPMQLYDPAFTEWDRTLLQHLGLEVIVHDEGGARRVESPTLFYLPHCEDWLCEALLGANWEPARLAQLAVLGNSFETYHERWTAPRRHASNAKPQRLLSLVGAGAVLEFPTPDAGFCVASAFNDMSLHVFSGALPDTDVRF